MSITFIVLLFCIKHFICDFLMQCSFQYKNKGKYLHPGGLEHAITHGLGTWPILLMFTNVELAVQYACLDAIIHYHIDWAKTNLNSRLKLTPTNSNWFWVLLGLDQLLHMITYLWIIENV